MARVKLGDYIIDETASGSTTANVALLMEETPDQGWSIFRELGGSSSRVLSFGCYIDTATATAREAALDAIKAALEAGGDFIVESPADTVQYRADRADRVAGYSYEINVDRQDTRAIVVVTLIYTLLPPPQGSGGGILDPDNLVGQVITSAVRAADGTVTVVAQAAFQDDDTTTGQAAAEAWINEWEDPSNYPDWVSPAVVIDSRVQIAEESAGVNGVATAQVTVQTLTLGLSPSNSALANVGQITVKCEVTPLPLDQRAGGLLPVAVNVFGTFTYDYERHKPFDSAGSPRAALTEPQIEAIVNLILTPALARAGQEGMQEVRRTWSYGPQGVYSFGVVGFDASTRVIRWQESLRIRAESNIQYRGLTGGGYEDYSPANASELVAQHSLLIEQIGGPPSYVEPSEVSASGWRCMVYDNGLPDVTNYAQGIGSEPPVSVYSNSWARVYTFKPEGRAGGGGGVSVSGIVLDTLAAVDGARD